MEREGIEEEAGSIGGSRECFVGELSLGGPFLSQQIRFGLQKEEASVLRYGNDGMCKIVGFGKSSSSSGQ